MYEVAATSDLESTKRSERAPWYRQDLLPLTVCLLTGLTMEMMPSLIQWFRLGDMIWIANGDELFYLAVGSQAYHNHPAFLSDPTQVSGGVSLFRQLPLLPGIWMAWLFGWGPLGIEAFWHVIAGLSIGAMWYLLIRQFVSSPWIATAMAVVLMVDIGLITSGLFFRQAQMFAAFLSGKPDLIKADFMHPQWRFPTPALTMAYLLLNICLVTRARQNPTRWSLLFSGISYGLLFHVYPYFWTAATAALALAFLVDQGHRRVYVWTGLIGLLIGSIRIYYDLMLKRETAPDWLVRANKFVPISRLTELRLPILGSLLLIFGFFWIWKQRRELIYLWSMGCAGVVLFKHHVVTGLNVENFHWVYVWAPCCSLLLLLVIVSLLPRLGNKARLAISCFMVLCLADLFVGLTLRAVESVRSWAGLDQVENYHSYRVQRISSGTPSLVPNSTAAGELQFVNYACVLENQRPLDNYWVTLSPSVTDVELDQRVALNAHLLGQDRATLEAKQRDLFRVQKGSGGPSHRDASYGERRVAHRLAAFDQVATDPEIMLNRYGVRYLGLRVGHAPPGYLTKQNWTRIQEGPFWQVWERRP
jgi:hypothetical protein